MKKLFFMLILIFAGTAADAQAWTGKGDQKINAGLSAWGYGTGITGTYDYGLNSLISVGAGLNVYFDKDSNDENRVFAFGRVNFHLKNALQLPEKLDIYPGVDVGVVGRNFGLGAHIGARYFFTERIGVFAEVGNNGSLGVSINL
ncbi:DUF6646 family protein [uncultured Chryseobacterium sp.]|uniref:DUF6646 family protein n=1 Tax=uncultured Chryseobacterium sp. TaxID=259322 RepID=UPI0025ECF354|nr:DUF6646 family protein [uncultured Chryseobacterium sp.]